MTHLPRLADDEFVDEIRITTVLPHHQRPRRAMRHARGGLIDGHIYKTGQRQIEPEATP